MGHKVICNVCGEVPVTGRKDVDQEELAVVVVLDHMIHNESHIVVLDGITRFWVECIDGVSTMRWDDEVLKN